MGLMGQLQPSSAGLGRLPGHRAAGSAQVPPSSGYTRAASPPRHLHLRGRAGARAQSLFCTPTLMEQGGSD